MSGSARRGWRVILIHVAVSRHFGIVSRFSGNVSCGFESHNPAFFLCSCMWQDHTFPAPITVL